LFLSSFSHAYFQKNEAGQEVFSFTSSFQSPRNAALERSNAALPSADPGIVLLNPAALRTRDSISNTIALHWQTGDFADNQGMLSYTHAFGTMLLQASYGWIAYGDIDGYDESGNKTGVTHSPRSQLATATLAFPLPHFEFGTTIKFVSDLLSGEVGDRTAIALAFDWGLLWQPKTSRFGVGLSARDFGTMIRDYTDDGEDESYAMGETVALSAYFRPGSLPRLALLLETTFPRYSEPALNLGGEYALGSSFFIRFGFTRTWLDLSRDVKQVFASDSRPDETNDARFLSAGLGYDNSRFAVDYAFSYLAQGLGMEHRVGLRFYF
jgi:hypothetical protein